MAGEPTDLVGVHYVRTRRGPLDSRWQVYAWRGKGAPCILTVDQVLKPRLTPAAVKAYGEAHEARLVKPAGDTFGALVEAYLGSQEYLGLEPYTRRDYRLWAERAKDEFLSAKVKWFDDPRLRADIIKWRDKWSHSPRQRKYATQVLSVLFGWGAERGWLQSNPVRLIKKNKKGEYKADRADILWTDEEIEAVAAKMAPHVARAFRLAAWTGLPRADLITLAWGEIGDLYITRKRNKTKVRQRIPIFDQTRELLKQFPRKQLVVVTNHRGQKFTDRGFSRAVEKARNAAGVAVGKTLHDLRGTFATKLVRLGYTDELVDEILGWETGKSKRIRRVYISHDAVVVAAVERMRDSTTQERRL